MAIHISKDSIQFHSVAWGLFSFGCLAILIIEFFKNTLIIADALALAALSVSFLVHSFHPTPQNNQQKKVIPAQHKVILSICIGVFFLSFMVRYGWL